MFGLNLRMQFVTSGRFPLDWMWILGMLCLSTAGIQVREKWAMKRLCGKLKGSVYREEERIAMGNSEGITYTLFVDRRTVRTRVPEADDCREHAKLACD